MDFEFDPAKSDQNLAKHGIDFAAAQALWLDGERVTVGPSHAHGEPRYHLIAGIEDKIWSAFYTYRNGRVRIISVRRARPEEIERYANTAHPNN